MQTRLATALPFTELEVATGNFDTSRSPIDRIVIHTMVGTWQAAAARFDNPSSQVSAHYGVKLDGTLIHWLEETFTAYHAGNYTMNQRSIGIEHEDNGDYNGVRPDVLYTKSAKLVRDICTFYNIPIDRQHILKHSEIIATGCPDALDIDRIVREANQPSSLEAQLSQAAADRNANWMAFVTVVQALGILPNADNKPATVNAALKAIKDLQERPTEIVKTVEVPVKDSSSSLPLPTPIQKSNGRFYGLWNGIMNYIMGLWK